MQEDQTATLSEAVSAQPHGVVLAWSFYNDGAAVDSDWSYFFVPKHHVLNHNQAGMYCGAISPWQHMGKYVYVGDTAIYGNSVNDTTTTSNGVTTHNDKYVLRYVIGV